MSAFHEVENILRAATQARTNADRATLEESKALAVQGREVVTAMLTVVDHARKLVALAQNTVDLAELGSLLTSVAIMHHGLVERAERYEERAARLAAGGRR